MNKKYWRDFYSMSKPSAFAKFCVNYLPMFSLILDVGCGNGRDSYYFSKKGYYVVGIDYASDPACSQRATFYNLSIDEMTGHENVFNVIYSRFLLHSVTTDEVRNLIEWSKGLFMAEFRAKGDKPRLYTNHKRNFIDEEWVKNVLKANGFKILYFKKSRGFSKFKGEDPLIVRVIAKK